MRLRIKDFAVKVGSGITPKGGAEIYQKAGIPLFRSQNVTDDGFLMDDIAYISPDIDNSMSGSRVLANDVLLNITGASIGRCYFTAKDFIRGNVNQHVCIIRPRQNIVTTKFLYYCLISASGKEQIKLSQNGANREGLTIESIKNFSFNIPSLERQMAISDYLDIKLKNIKEQIYFLSKKKEKFQQLKVSLIYNTVFHGLNPSATMKDTGIDWIGMIPQSWEMKRVKDICSYVSRGCTPSYVDISKYYVMNQATFSKGYIDISNVRYTANYNNDALLRPGDLIMASTGGGVLGKVLYYDDKQAKFIADSHVTIFRDKRNEMKYYYYLFSIQYKMINDCLSKGSTNQTELQRDKVLSLMLPYPPYEEQVFIANYLDENCSKIDTIMEKISQEITLLDKLKKSLINEVITGKRTV